MMCLAKQSVDSDHCFELCAVLMAECFNWQWAMLTTLLEEQSKLR